MKPRPSTIDPWKDRFAFAARRYGLPLTRAAGSSDGVIAETVTPSAYRRASSPSGARLVHTAQNSSTALRDGHGSLFTARRMVTPPTASWSSPTSRVSPCARVLVAIRPVWPPTSSSWWARSTK